MRRQDVFEDPHLNIFECEDPMSVRSNRDSHPFLYLRTENALIRDKPYVSLRLPETLITSNNYDDTVLFW
jgi:hypothetical protein